MDRQNNWGKNSVYPFHTRYREKVKGEERGDMFNMSKEKATETETNKKWEKRKKENGRKIMQEDSILLRCA